MFQFPCAMRMSVFGFMKEIERESGKARWETDRMKNLRGKYEVNFDTFVRMTTVTVGRKTLKTGCTPSTVTLQFRQ